MAEPLRDFITEGIRARRTADELRIILQQQGWSQRELDAAFADIGYSDGLAIPVPKPQQRLGARGFLLNLLAVGGFYLVLHNLVAMAFSALDCTLPDAAGKKLGYFCRDSGGLLEEIAGNLSLIITALPVAWWAERQTAKSGTNTGKWRTLLLDGLTFIAALVSLGMLSSTVYLLLTGELAWRFVIKTLIIIAAAGVIRLYYLSRNRA